MAPLPLRLLTLVLAGMWDEPMEEMVRVTLGFRVAVACREVVAVQAVTAQWGLAVTQAVAVQAPRAGPVATGVYWEPVAVWQAVERSAAGARAGRRRLVAPPDAAEALALAVLWLLRAAPLRMGAAVPLAVYPRGQLRSWWLLD